MTGSPTVVLVAASSNQAKLLAGLVDELRAAGTDPVLVAADHRRRSSDSAERALARLEVPFVRYPFRDVAVTSVLPGRRKFRTPARRPVLEGWLRGLAADAVVVGNDSRPVAVPLLAAARACGARTVLVQDGVRPVRRAGAPAPVARRRLLSARYRRYGHGGCDRVAVIGERDAAALVADGVPAGTVEVTGSPAFDRYARAEPVPAAGPVGASPHVVYIAQTLEQLDPATMAAHLGDVAVAVAAAGGRLTVKAHPRDASFDEVASRLRQARPEVEAVRDVDPEALLRSASLVLTPFSTMSLEAMILGVPVALVDSLPVPWTLDLGDAVPHVATTADLDALLGRVLGRPHAHAELVRAQCDALAWACRPVDGRATARVAAAVAREAHAAGDRSGRAQP